jgi:hypothetical protein
VSDLRNLRKNVALPSTRLVDPSLRKQRKSDTSSVFRTEPHVLVGGEPAAVRVIEELDIFLQES